MEGGSKNPWKNPGTAAKGGLQSSRRKKAKHRGGELKNGYEEDSWDRHAMGGKKKGGDAGPNKHYKLAEKKYEGGQRKEKLSQHVLVNAKARGDQLQSDNGPKIWHTAVLVSRKRT